LAGEMDKRDGSRCPSGSRGRRVPRGRGPDEKGGGRAWLFDSPPGLTLLPYRHIGDEWTVILSGVFHDGDRTYRIGDFGPREDGETHQPSIGAGERCVSLIMVRESPKYTTTVGRFAAP